MITVQNIIDEVNRLIVLKYPNYTVYISNMPEGFERPSFFIDLILESSTSENRYFTDEHIAIQIVYFAKVDGYYNADMVEQLKVSKEIKSLFKQGYIKVEDRAIKVTNIQGAPRDSEVYLTIDFEFVEEKPNAPYESDDGYNIGGIEGDGTTNDNGNTPETNPSIKYMENIIMKQGVDK